MIEINFEPTRREVRIFGLLWLLFFAGVGFVAWWKPAGLAGAAIILGTAWLVSLLFNPANKRVQLLGFALPALFGAISAGVRFGPGTRPILMALGAIGVLGALAIGSAPGIGRSIYVGWMQAAAPVGWTISHLILGAVYYFVLVPVGLLMRLFGRDPLDRSFDREAPSYWVERIGPIEPARYFRQF